MNPQFVFLKKIYKNFTFVIFASRIEIFYTMRMSACYNPAIR